MNFSSLIFAHANLLIALCLAAVIFQYFRNNPLGHSRWFMVRRFINWFPLGMTYSFLYMGRYNLNVSKNALGTLMTKEDFGTIFAIGTLVYGCSFLVNGPLVDKIGGKKGIIIAAIGSAIANILLGVLTYFTVIGKLHMNMVVAYSTLYAINMYQGQGLLVSCARTRRLRRDFRRTDFHRRLFRVRLGTTHRGPDQGEFRRRMVS
jgi:OPA family glycerol-3-phosphate transporter-like MFS transporter